MADQLQLRGGTTAEHASFTGALREVTVDIDKDTVVVHDNTTAGGHPLAKEDLSNVSAATTATKLANQTVAFNGGAAATPSVTFNGDTNTGIYSPGADQVAISSNGSERLRITSDGKVGIGTTSIDASLHVKGAGTHGSFVLEAGGTTGTSNQIYIQGHNNAGTSLSEIHIEETATNQGALVFKTNGGSVVERMRIDSSGRLLVGTSSARTVGTGNFHIQSEGTGSECGISTTRNSNGSSGSNIRLVKTRGTAAGASTIVQNGDSLGVLSWWGTDGTNAVEAANIYAQVDGTPGANTMPGRLVFSTTSTTPGASPTERMRIDNAGRTQIYASSTGLGSYTNAAAGTSVAVFIGRHSATSTTNGTDSFRVYSNGNVVNTGNSYGPLSSDERLKQDIVDAGSQWDDIKAVRLTKFRFKNDSTGELQLGPIAQELEQVSPGLITRRPASEDEIADPSNGLVDGDEVLSFKASVLYMKAVGALQEAMERIEVLEAKVNALEGN